MVQNGAQEDHSQPLATTESARHRDETPARKTRCCAAAASDLVHEGWISGVASWFAAENVMSEIADAEGRGVFIHQASLNVAAAALLENFRLNVKWAPTEDMGVGSTFVPHGHLNYVTILHGCAHFIAVFADCGQKKIVYLDSLGTTTPHNELGNALHVVAARFRSVWGCLPPIEMQSSPRQLESECGLAALNNVLRFACVDPPVLTRQTLGVLLRIAYDV
jgi:hypothetical protein